MLLVCMQHAAGAANEERAREVGGIGNENQRTTRIKLNEMNHNNNEKGKSTSF